MKSLGVNWFIEGSIDFEHKKYILLDYLQEINRHFDRSKLYPNLTDLIFHYNNLLDFKRNKTVLQQAFPQQMAKADIEAVKLTYQKIIQDDSSMQEIESIISYALHKMDPAIQTGKEIYDFVESHLNIDPIGLVPLMPYSGYFSLRNGRERTTGCMNTRSPFLRTRTINSGGSISSLWILMSKALLPRPKPLSST
ncbi:MAG: hypothetical protein JWQ66_3162 [Mucilaginibacter sp.]|nr:hypothetical protein [Mucilaginibacter sp.]